MNGMGNANDVVSYINDYLHICGGSKQLDMEKYLNKYRIPSARMQGYDYGQNGAYFITICTHNREHYFGSIADQEMQLNELGVLAEKYWHEIPQHFPFVQLGHFVAMPNHVHGVLLIDKPDTPTDAPVETLHCNVFPQKCDAVPIRRNVTTGNDAPNEQMSQMSPHAGSVSAIIRSYKSIVCKHARHIHATFAWQTRFHDHIIRNGVSYDRIQQYILTNPQHWEADTLFT